MSRRARKLAQCPGWAGAPARPWFGGARWKGPGGGRPARRCGGWSWRVCRRVRVRTGFPCPSGLCWRVHQEAGRTASAERRAWTADRRPAQMPAPVTFLCWNFLEGALQSGRAMEGAVPAFCAAFVRKACPWVFPGRAECVKALRRWRHFTRGRGGCFPQPGWVGSTPKSRPPGICRTFILRLDDSK